MTTLNCKNIIMQGEVLFEQIFTYNSTVASICPDHLHINNDIVPFSEVEKIKMFPDIIHDTHHKIKVTHFGK